MRKKATKKTINKKVKDLKAKELENKDEVFKRLDTLFNNTHNG